MVDQKQLELIQAEIDGCLDERQRAELSRGLLADPELRAAREQMRRLCQALDAVQEVEPPAQLLRDVHAALPQTFARRAAQPRTEVKWRYAAALAGLLLTGTLVFRAMDFGQRPATTEMAGTLAGTRSAVTMDMVQVSSGVVSGRVGLIRSAGKLGLTFELAAVAPVDALISAGGHSLQVTGLGPRGTHGAGPTTVALPGPWSGVQAVNVTLLISGREVGHAALKESASR